MPPEGKVGISPVCLQGVNINAGHEISLRLRTDDLKVLPWDYQQTCPGCWSCALRFVAGRHCFRCAPLQVFRMMLQGFRRYRKIREMLVHKLTHMVWGDHDNNFKELNSQLLRESAHLDWTAQSGGPAGRHRML